MTLGDGITAPAAIPRITEEEPREFAKYDLVSFVQHMGSLGGGHYIAHVKHRHSGQWLTCDDSNVYPIDAKSALNKEAYVLFFVRSSSLRATTHVPIPPPAADEAVEFYVSRSWWWKYCCFVRPGPISNADIVCDHGNIKQQLAAEAQKYVIGLTRGQYLTLTRAYGCGEPPLMHLRSCETCSREAAALAERRVREQGNIVKLDTIHVASSEFWYIISEKWLKSWRDFIQNVGPHDGTGRGTLPPGPIDNSRLLHKDGTPLKNQRPEVHYRAVNSKVWNFLHNIYGGGPTLIRRKIDVYSEPVDPNAPLEPTPAATGIEQ